MEYSGSYKGVGNMENGRVDGVVSFPGGIYGDLKISGVATAEGPIEAETLHIDGVFNARSDVNCKKIRATGVVTIDGNLRAKEANVDGVVTVHGTKVEVDRIVCDGVLSCDGQISADYINAQGFINAPEIVGDNISIQSFSNSIFFKMWTKLKEAVVGHDYSKVDLIEATTITLRGVHARNVTGQDINIGPGCIIDKVDASGVLFVDQSAEVNEVVNNN